MNFATHILETCGIHNFLLKEEDVFFSVLAIKWCSVTQLCPILCNPTDCSPPGSSVHGILQARILEWVAISSSRGSSQPRDQTRVSCASCIGRQILYHCVPWEAWQQSRELEAHPFCYWSSFPLCYFQAQRL